MRKWIPALLILASAGFALAVYSRLPAAAAPRLGALLPWTLPQSTDMPRTVIAFGVPVLAAAVWLLLLGLASTMAERFGRKALPAWLLSEKTGAHGVERFEPTYHTIVLTVVAGLLMFHAIMLGTVLGWPAWTLQAFTGLIGGGLVLVGNIMPRTRPNWIAGLRTRAALASPDAWRTTHRRFGAALMIVGILVIGLSVLAPSWALVVAVAGSLGSAIVATATLDGHPR